MVYSKPTFICLQENFITFLDNIASMEYLYKYEFFFSTSFYLPDF